MGQFIFLTVLLLVISVADPTSKPHVMSFGKPKTVKGLLGPAEERSLTIPVRPYKLETKLTEYVAGGRRTTQPTGIRGAPGVPGDRLAVDRILGELAVAAWRLVTGRPQHGPNHATQAVPVRSVLLRRRRQSLVCDLRANHDQEAAVKKSPEKLDGEFLNAVGEAPVGQRIPARGCSPSGGEQLRVDFNGRFADVASNSPVKNDVN